MASVKSKNRIQCEYFNNVKSIEHVCKSIEKSFVYDRVRQRQDAQAFPENFQ